jgi:hypothetical protein
LLGRLIGRPPRETPPVDWAAVQETLGLRLPADFMAFASAYGRIELGEFVWVWSPAGAAARFDHGTREWLREFEHVAAGNLVSIASSAGSSGQIGWLSGRACSGTLPLRSLFGWAPTHRSAISHVCDSVVVGP